MANIQEIKRIALTEFSHIIIDAFSINYKLRIVLIDKSFIDVNLSRTFPDKFGFHWERKDNFTIYRYDNFPDTNWSYVSTYPYHVHDGNQNNVIEPPFKLTIYEGFRDFMEFVKNKIQK